jgi:hypothetical protein
MSGVPELFFFWCTRREGEVDVMVSRFTVEVRRWWVRYVSLVRYRNSMLDRADAQLLVCADAAQ